VYRSNGDRESAAADYRKALSLNPRDADKKEIEASLNGLDTGGEPGPAEDQGSASAAKPPANEQQARSATGGGESEAAASETPSTVDVEPSDDPKTNADFKACTKGKLDEAALSACDSVIEGGKLASSWLPIALSVRCYIRQSKGDVDRGLKDCDRAIEMKPDHALYYYFRGLAYQTKGDRDDAKADFNKALALNPNDDLKGEITAQLDQLGRAPASPQADAGGSAQAGDNISHGDGSASPSNPDPDYQACRNTSGDDAIEACNRVIASGKFADPELALAYNRRGYMSWGKGDYRSDLADQNRAIELDPHFSRAYSDRGMAYYAKRDYRHAIADFNKSIEVDPKFSLAYSNRGAVYESQRKYDQAMADFGTAISLNPDLALAYYNRATIYEALGRRADAISEYRRALLKDPNDQDIKNALKKLGVDQSEDMR
jgi:tetratricopeptide (TPR) repeat protein